MLLKNYFRSRITEYNLIFLCVYESKNDAVENSRVSRAEIKNQ